MGRFMYKDQPYGGASSYATAVKCIDKDGNTSTVQAELDNVQDAIDSVDNKFGGLRLGVDGDGNCGYYKADDSFVPFKSKDYAVFTMTFDDADQNLSSGNKTKTYNISSIFKDYQNITASNFLIQLNTFGKVFYDGSSGTREDHSRLPSVTAYDANTGVVSITCGKWGFQKTNAGAWFCWARNITVIVFK